MERQSFVAGHRCSVGFGGFAILGDSGLDSVEVFVTEQQRGSRGVVLDGTPEIAVHLAGSALPLRNGVLAVPVTERTGIRAEADPEFESEPERLPFAGDTQVTALETGNQIDHGSVVASALAADDTVHGLCGGSLGDHDH